MAFYTLKQYFDEKPANFLKRANATLTIRGGTGKEPSWEPHGNHYRITIKTPKGSYAFDFWGSEADEMEGKQPTIYQVLSSLDPYYPEDLPIHPEEQ